MGLGTTLTLASPLAVNAKCSKPGPSTTAPTCEGNPPTSNGTSYLTKSGAVYDIICGREYHGDDLSFLHAANFAECIFRVRSDTRLCRLLDAPRVGNRDESC